MVGIGLLSKGFLKIDIDTCYCLFSNPKSLCKACLESWTVGPCSLLKVEVKARTDMKCY